MNMTERPNFKYVTYLRVSSRHQVQGDGFERQRLLISQRYGEFNQQSGNTHMAEFTEDGVSGTAELINRPALTRLCQYIVEHGGIDAVIVEKADRLARDLITSELILRQFNQMGVRVIEAEGGTDLTAGESDNPTAKLIRQVLAAVAEFEKSSIVLKLRSARNRKRVATGRCEGQKPYGYYEGEPQVVQRMRSLRAGGMTVRDVAQALNADGIRSRSGRPWSHSVVAAVLARGKEVGV